MNPFILQTKTSPKINIQISGQDEKSLINPPLLEQAIINLVDNAIKYSPNNSNIEIKLYESNNYLNISIQDQGHGIPKEHHERLFERFYGMVKRKELV